ncbi:MAG: hypothetical protein PQ975_00795 [Methanobacterium sp.]|jgi:hypothetical protein
MCENNHPNISIRPIICDTILLFIKRIYKYLGAKLFEVIDVFLEEVHETTPVNMKKELFILLDEAHYDKEWSRADKILYDQSKKYFLYSPVLH